MELAEYYPDRGMERQLTAPYSPQQNRVVEQQSQTVVSMLRCKMEAK